MINEENLLSKYHDLNEGYVKEILPIKKKLYFEYIDNHNFLFDLKIILKTLFKILIRS